MCDLLWEPSADLPDTACFRTGTRTEFGFEFLRGNRSRQAHPCVGLLRSIPPGHHLHLARTGRRLANLLSGECADHSGIFGLSSTRTCRLSREKTRPIVMAYKYGQQKFDAIVADRS